MGLFTEKHTPQIDHGPSQKARAVPGYGVVSFCRVGNFEWEEYSSFYGEEAGISRNWATFYCLTFMVSRGSAMAPVVA